MNTATRDDFFRSCLDQRIELRHPLAVFASRMPWQEIEASIAQCFARQVRQGKKIEDFDLFGGVSAIVGSGVSNADRPRLPLRLMTSLLYLKHTFNESDEQHQCEAPGMCRKFSASTRVKAARLTSLEPKWALH